MKAKFEIKIAKELTREVDGNIIYEEDIYLDEESMRELENAADFNERGDIVYNIVFQSISNMLEVKL